jgi:mercuric ion transport protein
VVKRISLLGIGIVGTVVAAICCFTPALVLGLSAVGLAGRASSASLDMVLLGALGVFVAVAVYALFRRSPGRGPGSTHEAGNE